MKIAYLYILAGLGYILGSGYQYAYEMFDRVRLSDTNERYLWDFNALCLCIIMVSAAHIVWKFNEGRWVKGLFLIPVAASLVILFGLVSNLVNPREGEEMANEILFDLTLLVTVSAMVTAIAGGFLVKSEQLRGAFRVQSLCLIGLIVYFALSAMEIFKNDLVFDVYLTFLFTPLLWLQFQLLKKDSA